ncbi:unnamed protein product [Ectocarpus sp. 12 AP-2014]
MSLAGLLEVRVAVPKSLACRACGLGVVVLQTQAYLSSLADSGLNLRAIVVSRSSAGGTARGRTDAGWHPLDATRRAAGDTGGDAQGLGMSSVKVGSRSLLVDSDLNPHVSAVNRPSAGGASFGSIGTIVGGALGSQSFSSETVGEVSGSQPFSSGMVSGTSSSQPVIPGMVCGTLGSQCSIPPPSTPSREWWEIVASGNTLIPGPAFVMKEKTWVGALLKFPKILFLTGLTSRCRRGRRTFC